MKKIEWKRFVTIIKDRFIATKVTETSVQLAYYILLSVIPLLIVVGNLLPFFNIDPVLVTEYISPFLPDAVQQSFMPIVEEFLTQSRGGLIIVSLVVFVYSSSRGVFRLQKAMNRAYGVKKKKNYLSKRIMSVVTIFAIILALVIFLMIFSIGETLLGAMEGSAPWVTVLHGALLDFKWPVIIIFVLLMTTLVYVIAPDCKVRVLQALPGAIVSTIALIILAELFGLYVRVAVDTFISYGALSSFLILIIWLNFSAVVIISGVVVNASIMEYRHGKLEHQDNQLNEIIHQTIMETPLAKKILSAQENPEQDAALSEPADPPSTASSADEPSPEGSSGEKKSELAEKDEAG